MNDRDHQWLEKDIHSAVVAFLDAMRELGQLTYFVNLEGGRRDVRQQVALKSHGARPGRPDIEVLIRGGKVVFIELKRLRGGRVSAAQAGEMDVLKALGFECHVVKALQGSDAIKAIEDIIFKRGETDE